MDDTTYTEKVKMILINQSCQNTKEALFICDVDWITDDALFTEKQKKFIDSIYYRSE